MKVDPLMETKDTVAYCNICKRKVTFHFDPVNHRKHLLVCICTLGLSLPFWLCMTIYRAKICDCCNNSIM
jgi:hypothetical protein